MIVHWLSSLAVRPSIGMLILSKDLKETEHDKLESNIDRLL